jgi:hypothetical protein
VDERERRHHDQRGKPRSSPDAESPLTVRTAQQKANATTPLQMIITAA